MITVLTCRGTGEQLGSPTNMLSQFTAKLDSNKYLIGADVDYPASRGVDNPQHSWTGCSEEESILQGMDAIAAAVRAVSGRVGLVGYSLGAEVVSRFLMAQAEGRYPDCAIAWAATIANPLRAEGDSIDQNPVGYGINGQRGPYPAGLPT